MIETVEDFLIKHNLNKPENTFLVGFSGGCDSLCLLDILYTLSHKYGYKVVAAHLNHNWRGEESAQEEQNCKRYCDRINIECLVETLDSSGQKTESHARQARYDFFLKHAKNYRNCSIFTAHTRTDNAETIIYRLIKGTGIKGLQGIPPMRMVGEVPVYRPLLNISRKNIEDYCNSKGLVANTDSSNFDTTYKRNFIRHKIMPLFDEINFHAEKSIASLAEIATSQTNIVNEYIDKILKEVYVNNQLLTEKFKILSEDVKLKIIYDACLKYNLDYDRKKITHILEFITENQESKAGLKYSLSNDLWLYVNSKYIYLINTQKHEKNMGEIKITKEGEWDFNETKTFSLKKYEGGPQFVFPHENAYIAYINLPDSKIDFTLRTRRDGDYIVPFGMNGSMKLKKYLNAKSVSKHFRDDIVMLTKDSEVFWAAGVGLSNKLKVVNTPTHMLELKDKKID
jgi:tRNA(Ile)-lysidine synthase